MHHAIHVLDASWHRNRKLVREGWGGGDKEEDEKHNKEQEEDRYHPKQCLSNYNNYSLLTINNKKCSTETTTR